MISVKCETPNRLATIWNCDCFPVCFSATECELTWLWSTSRREGKSTRSTTVEGRTPQSKLPYWVCHRRRRRWAFWTALPSWNWDWTCWLREWTLPSSTTWSAVWVCRRPDASSDVGYARGRIRSGAVWERGTWLHSGSDWECRCWMRSWGSRLESDLSCCCRRRVIGSRVGSCLGRSWYSAVFNWRYSQANQETRV
jgi:hypothetical protein